MRLALRGNIIVMDDRNVILTGFMGTGKTSVGRLLAERLGYEWVDTDSAIEAQHGPIPEIFADAGEAHFRELEAELAAELGTRSRLVISTGGRMMLDWLNAVALSERGRVFCLTASVETIVARIAEAGAEARPLLMADDVPTAVRALLRAREPGYARFEQVSTEGRSIAQVVDEILERLGPRMRDDK